MSPAPGLHVLTAREASAVACLTDVLVAPGDGLPAVRDTDAVAAFDAQLAAAPATHRVALRAAVAAVELGPLALGPRRRRLRRLAPAERSAYVERLGRHPALGGAFEPLRSLLVLSFYGDEAVLRRLGYDAQAVVARAHEAVPA